MPRRTPRASPTMTTPLVPLHVTPDTKRLPTPSMRAPKRLLPRMTMAMDFQTTGAAKGLAARAAHIPILGLRGGKLCRGRRGGNIVVMMVVRWWGGIGTIRGCRREQGRAVPAVGRCGAAVWCCGEGWIDGRCGVRAIIGGGRTGGNGANVGWERSW